MSNLGPTPGADRAGRPPTLPTLPTGMTIARYATYAEAQRAVDFLSDNAFPVQFVTIVGTDLRMVERVIGRLTYGRAAVGGMATGAYLGLFVGLLMWAFGGSGDFSPFFAVILGAGFGMLFGVISYALTRGRRDFTSASQIVATEYQVLCAEQHAPTAMEVLGRLVSAGGPRSLPAPTGPAAPAAQDKYGPPPDHPGYPPAAGVPGFGVQGRYGEPAPHGDSASYGRPPATVPPPAATPAPPPTQEPPVEGLTYGDVMQARRRERQDRERQEQQRVDQQRVDQQRLDQQRLDQQRQDQQRQDQERQDQERQVSAAAEPEQPPRDGDGDGDGDGNSDGE